MWKKIVTYEEEKKKANDMSEKIMDGNCQEE